MATAAHSSEPPAHPFAFLKDDVKTQRRIAGELLADVDRLDRLLQSSTAALGTDEVAFLRALRIRLLAEARTLAENANATSTAATYALTRTADA